MSNGNFPNGSLVMRIWKSDGSSDILAKFQYFSDAEFYCQKMVERDAECGRNKDNSTFLLAVCDYEVKARAFAALPEVLA